MCRHTVAGWISIHAPREGGDTPPKTQEQLMSISIHAPREGGDKYGHSSWISD